jgi:hypothetical protein
MTPELIINTLERCGGYRRVAQPLHIADVDFDFSGALVGPGDQQALTLILDGSQISIAAALRRLRAFAVVLERSGSTRPINVVLLAESPDRAEVAALEQVARVIVVQPHQQLENSLHILFPLQLPEPIPATESAEKTLREELLMTTSPLTLRLLKAGMKSASAVEEEMRKALIELTAVEQ